MNVVYQQININVLQVSTFVLCLNTKGAEMTRLQALDMEKQMLLCK